MEFDVHLVGLYLHQIHRLLGYLDFMKSLAVLACLLTPGMHGAFVNLEGFDDRLERTAVRKKCNDPSNGLRRILFAVKHGSVGDAEGLGAGGASVALFEAVVDTNVVLILQTS